ncbi:MAG: fluoride efflux transporter CrcB [Acidaminococcaceae bacterium]|jgi:CrcB protein|nr:fluoride efflux transporter CrcB [Acidaminococcaceae bacterium]
MYLDMLMVLVGGGLGALLRYLITLTVYGDKAPAFPYGTLIVNLLGCFCIGLLAGYFQRHPELPMFLKLFAITGVLGGLTTFSTFSLETFNLLYLHPVYAVANITCSVAAGLICVAVGMQVIQSIL